MKMTSKNIIKQKIDGYIMLIRLYLMDGTIQTQYDVSLDDVRQAGMESKAVEIVSLVKLAF